MAFSFGGLRGWRGSGGLAGTLVGVHTSLAWSAVAMFALTAALLKHGYSEADVQKIRGGNFLRVIQQVMPK